MPRLMLVPPAFSEELKQTDIIAFYILGKPALPASPGRSPPSVMTGFGISVQPGAPASHMRLLCEQ